MPGTAVRICLSIVLVVAAGSVLSTAQSNQPLSKNDLIAFLRQARSKGLADKQTTAQFIQIVRRRGVDFRMANEDETELRAEGARPELIAAVRTNYRASSAVADGGTRGKSSMKGDVKRKTSPNLAGRNFS